MLRKEFIERENLFKYKKIYDQEGSKEQFVRSMIESLDFHQRNNSFYKEFLEKNKFTTDKIKTIEDMKHIPSIPVNFFKYHDIKSVAEDDIHLHATSSGTLGQKSQVFLTKRDLQLGTKMIVKSMFYHKFISLIPTNYLLLGYEPKEGNQMGNVKVLQGMTKLAPPKEVVFAIRSLGDEYQVDYFGIINALKRFEKQGLPVRIFGFPAFLFMLLSTMKNMNMKPLKLNSKSIVFTGGGWKKMNNLEVSQSKLLDLIEEQLGITRSNCRDFYSAVEHSVAYPQCKHHHMHVPIWSRVLIRDIKTLEVVGFDQPGFLSFVSPLVSAMPLSAITMGDLAILRDGRQCGCGITTPYFEILGRAGTSQSKSCAVTASEMMGGQEHASF